MRTEQDIKKEYNIKEGEVYDYHVFADGVDDYVETYKEAYTIFKDLKKEGYGNIRIYIEVFEDGEMVYEDYVKGIGDFPF
jgi:hypothetical protein